MMIFLKAPMFLWVEAVATACYTQNRSLIHTRHNKTPYELVHDKKPDLTFFRVFGALCYPTNDSENLGKFQAKADIGIFVGYAPSRKGYRIYNKRTRRLMETIHVTFDEMHQSMAPVRMSSGPEPFIMTPGQLKSGLALTDKELEMLFQPMFDEYLEQSRFNEPVPSATKINAQVVPPGTSLSTMIAQDEPSTSASSSTFDMHHPVRHQEIEEKPTHEDPLINHDVLHPSHNLVTGDPGSAQSSSGNVNSAEPNQVNYPPDHLRRWTKDHPLDNIVGNPSRPVSTRKQLASDALWCCFHTELSKVEPKNFKMAVIEDCWFQAMQDEIHLRILINLKCGNYTLPIYVWVIALKWIYKVKRLDEYGDVLKTKHVEDQKILLNVYRLKKALYGLKQAPRAWYDTLLKFLLANNFFKGAVDPTSSIELPQSVTTVIDFVNEMGILNLNNNIHRRPGSAVHHTGDDYVLGNLKFVPKGESVEVFGMAIPDPLITEAIQQSSYYPKYLEMVAKNTKKTPQESASVQSATKRATPKKPTTTTPVKQSKPAPPPTKKPSKRKLPQKVRKGKPSFQLVDEDDEAQQESIPHEEGNDPDLERAKKMSLEALQEQREGEGDDADLERAIKLSLDPAFLHIGRDNCRRSKTIRATVS
ncbi:putative ribonuclease H-like domain-containing protein [Tanacetum coccineum]|uniref:Ribonuclease H-like domain-containing protein n=1 Tax=Tanacetum coccineum TaxID=301880 RepID=A0ABQ5ALR8_9ASTR